VTVLVRRGSCRWRLVALPGAGEGDEGADLRGPAGGEAV